MLLLSRQGVFLTVDDLYESIGKAQGGWYSPVALATDTSKVAGGRTGIPFGVSGNLLLRRNDVLKKAGFTKAPATWEELVQQAAAVNKPPLFGLGLALSNVGDGNVQISVMQSYGGRIADDTGKKVTIKSDATRTYPELGQGRVGQEALPAGQYDLGRRRRQPGLSLGPGGFHRQYRLGRHRGKDPGSGALRSDRLFVAARQARRASSRRSHRTCARFRRPSKNPDAAKALIEHLAQPAFMNAYYEAAIYGPVLQDQAKFAAFNGKDQILAGLLDLVRNGTAPAYPDVYNAAFADAFNNFVIPKMVQRVVIDNYDFDRAMDEAQTQTQAIYDKYK